MFDADAGAARDRGEISLTEATNPTTCRMLIAEALRFVAAALAAGGRG
jgi:hypothetical protein